MEKLFHHALLSLLLSCLPVTHALDRQALLQALGGPDRDPADQQRDAARKPVEVLEFLGLDAGMSVLDVYAAGGYYTFVLSKAVGSAGTVYAQNTEAGLSYQEGRLAISQGDAFHAKITANGLLNVRHLVAPVEQLDIPPGSLHLILLSEVLHDYYNGDPARAVDLLETLKPLLAPGGVIGLIDHSGIAGQDNRYMHRMQKEQALEVVARAGLRLVAESDLLRNEGDDHHRHVFHPSLGRNTDRFLLKLDNPDGRAGQAAPGR